MSAAGAVLDACVLVNASVRDTLLRVAVTAHFVWQLKQHFDDAWVEGYEPLVPKMTNDAKDRHVLACAVQVGAPVIVTFNGRHFPPEALDPWLVEAQDPDDFLVNLYRQQPEIPLRGRRGMVRSLLHALREQALAIRWELSALLAKQRKVMPRFVQIVADELALNV
jgi:hypothetical protein